MRSSSAAASLRIDALSALEGVTGRARGEAGALPLPPGLTTPAGPGEPVFLLSRLLKKLARTPSWDVAPAPATEAALGGAAVGSSFLTEPGELPADVTCGEPRDRLSRDLGTPDAVLTRAPSTRTPGPEGKAWKKGR
jgi:hypothetical protein